MKKWLVPGLAVVAIAVGSLDLLFGNTNTTLLPSWLGNKLTQQWDLVLIAIGVALFWWT